MQCHRCVAGAGVKLFHPPLTFEKYTALFQALAEEDDPVVFLKNHGITPPQIFVSTSLKFDPSPCIPLSAGDQQARIKDSSLGEDV